jgi:hypothetical protein
MDKRGKHKCGPGKPCHSLRSYFTIILQFWDSVDRIMQTQGIKSAHGQFGIIVIEMSKLAQLASEIRGKIFSSDASDYATTLLHYFIQTWMLLQMYLIFFGN